ncbi:MAG: DNA/RNA nuclease SfsA [Clostridiaceae bacterium]|nr:DNA/RNA nuclease SfsA [Clostridiaceae bacterium]
MKINIDGSKIEGIFKRRVNRFIAEVLVDNKIEIVHVANTGRMKELLTEGARVIVRKVNMQHRKTQYDLLMVYKEDTLISIDSKLPNTILQQAFLKERIHYFKGYTDVKREVTFGKSKFDFHITNKETAALIEAKCVTLVKENQLASFPDAPTERGRKHVLELIEAKKQGFRAAVFFIVQRNDAVNFTPNKDMDTAFYEACFRAKQAGVELYAYNCHVDRDYIQLQDELKIIL